MAPCGLWSQMHDLALTPEGSGGWTCQPGNMAGGGAEPDSKRSGGEEEGSAAGAGASSSAAAQLFQSYLQAYGGKATPHALLPPFPGLFSGQVSC